MGKVIAFALEAAGAPVVKGGAANAVAAFCGLIEEAGGEIRTDTDVARILVENNRAIGVRTVQGMVREKINYALYMDRARENMQAHLRAAKFAQFNVPIVDTLTGVAMAIVVVFGGAQVMESELDLGVMVAFTGLEILIAFLQAYVFKILTCIYLNDSLHMH